MFLNDCSKALMESLEKANLVPGSADGLIPVDFKPTTRLEASFGGKTVNAGNFFRASECRQVPSISFAAEADADAPLNASYLLLLTDPDAPTPDDPKFAFWRHWVVGGLKPASGGEDVVAMQDRSALTEYLGPGPRDEYVMGWTSDRP